MHPAYLTASRQRFTTHKIPLNFFENVNLLSILAYLSRKTWTQDQETYNILFLEAGCGEQVQNNIWLSLYSSLVRIPTEPDYRSMLKSPSP